MSNIGAVGTKDEAELFDLGQGKLWIGFVVRSLRRHWKRALLTFLFITSLSTFAALSSPKAYFSSTVMQAIADDLGQKQVQGPGASTSSQPAAVRADATIRSQGNLEKIVDDLKLVDRYNINLGPVAKAKKVFFEKIFGLSDAASKRRDLVSQLRNTLSVKTEDTEQVKQTINISLIWNDPQQLKEILDRVNKNYLADVRVSDIGQLEVARQVLQEKLDGQNAVVQRLREELGIPADDTSNLPESSPIRQELTIQSTLAQRFSDADLALASAEATFRLRYDTVSPAEVPKAPLSGSLKSLIIGLMGGVILAAFVTTTTDVMRGKVVETWQVARGMNLPLLAEIRG